MVVMVVGGNGQLGTACCAELLRRGVPVRASVRGPDRGAALQQVGVEVVGLDLTAGSAARRWAYDGWCCRPSR